MGRSFRRTQAQQASRTITVSGTLRVFDVPGKDCLLNEALAAGVPYPHSCTVGACGTCKTKLISGKIREITDSASGLTAEERRDGYILACQSVALESLELRVEGLIGTP